MARKSKKEINVITKLVNGVLVTIEDTETINEIEKMKNDITNIQHNKNEVLERNKISEDVKNELKISLEKNPELLPIIKILLGNSEIKRLIGVNNE